MMDIDSKVQFYTINLLKCEITAAMQRDTKSQSNGIDGSCNGGFWKETEYVISTVVKMFRMSYYVRWTS